MQKERSLFQRVGAVSDHYALHLIAGQQLGHPTGQASPGRLVHVLAVDLGQLLKLQPRPPARQRRYARQQLGHPDLRGPVAGMVRAIRTGAGDGAAGSQHNDLLRFHLSSPENWIKIQILVI